MTLPKRCAGCWQQLVTAGAFGVASSSSKPVQGVSRTPSNQGSLLSKSSQQHLFTPRDEWELFLAVALFWTGPVHLAAIRPSSVTSRISETLSLRGCDIRCEGGEDHDEPHVLFQRRPEDGDFED